MMRDGLVPTRRMASLMRGPLTALSRRAGACLLPQRSALVVVIGLLLVIAVTGVTSAAAPSIVQLTASDWPRHSAAPSISADGSVVAFASSADLTGGNPGGASQIFVMNVDGTGLTQLTSSATYGSNNPSINADGSVVAFESQANLTGENPDRSPEIFVVNSDGTGLLQLTSDPTEIPYVYRWSRWPSISDDGTVIAFASQAHLVPRPNPEHGYEIFVINSDGTGLRQLTDLLSYYKPPPSISGDGTVVAFHSPQDLTGENNDGSSEVFVINVDGTGLAQVTDAPTYSGLGCQNPSITADGSTIAFDSYADLTGEDPDHGYDIFVINSDGTGLAQLIVDGLTVANMYPSISADGSVIAFEVNIGHGYYIFAVNSDGTGITQLSSEPSEGHCVPSISGDGSLVTFYSNADLTGENPDNSCEVFLAVTADTIPPTIIAPPDVEVEESDPLGTPVDLGQPTVSDNSDPNPTVENDAPALFALGATTVTWTATDAAGNWATAEQIVRVVAGSLENQLANLRKLILYGVASGQIAPETEESLLAKVDAAIAALD
ncbi:MAG: PD40 domain-containing protein, partial [Gemmatimonadota bacterium]